MPYRSDDRIDLSKLKDHERLAFGALMRMLLSLGGYQTPDMRDQVQAVAESLDPELFWNALHEAREIYESDEVEQLASKVLRPQAQDLIFVVLNEVAIIGSISRGEASLLDWLQAQWDIAVETLPEE